MIPWDSLTSSRVESNDCLAYFTRWAGWSNDDFKARGLDPDSKYKANTNEFLYKFEFHHRLVAIAFIKLAQIKVGAAAVTTAEVSFAVDPASPPMRIRALNLATSLAIQHAREKYPTLSETEVSVFLRATANQFAGNWHTLQSVRYRRCGEKDGHGRYCYQRIEDMNQAEAVAYQALCAAAMQVK